MHVTLKSSLQLQPADNFGEVSIYSAGLAFASFGLTLLFSGGGLPAPGGAVRCHPGSTGSGQLSCQSAGETGTGTGTQILQNPRGGVSNGIPLMLCR